MTVATRLRMGGRTLLAPNLAGTLALWFKADALGLANNDPVSSWTDSSGNARHAVQATSGKRPLYKTNALNGQPVLRFDGTDDNLLTGTFTALAQPNTIVAVVKPIVVAVGGNFLDGPGGARCQFGDRGRYEIYAGGDDIHPGPFGWEPAAGVPVVTSAFYDAAASVVRVNGSAGGAGSATIPGTNAPTRVAVGSNGAEGSEFWNGDVAEVCIYNARLSLVTLQRVEWFLGAKYGIPVS